MVYDSTNITSESAYKISHSCVNVLIFYVLLFGVVYLELSDFAMDPTKEQWVCIKFCAKLENSVMETLALTREAFGEESMSHTRVFEWHARFRAGQTYIEIDQHTSRTISSARWDRWTTKSRACSSFSLTSTGLFKRNASWQAKQSIPYTTVTSYGDCIKMCKDFATKFGDNWTGYCITTTHLITLSVSPGKFWPKTTWLSSPTLPTLLIPWLKIELKGCNFDTIQASEAESQAALNTLTEHDFQDAFKK
jgi:hypothetical protein